MPVKELISLFSIVLGIVAAVPYIRGMIGGTTRPHMFSWLIWGLSCGIAGAVQWAEGGGPGSWFMILNSIYCLGIAVSAFWFGTRNVKKIDGVVLAVTLSAIPLWFVTKNPLWSVLLITLIDGLGYIPTIRKSWSNPYEEVVLTWALSCVMFTLSVMALTAYKITTWLYPGTFAVINVGFVVFLLIRRKQLGDMIQNAGH